MLAPDEDGCMITEGRRDDCVLLMSEGVLDSIFLSLCLNISMLQKDLDDKLVGVASCPGAEWIDF